MTGEGENCKAPTGADIIIQHLITFNLIFYHQWLNHFHLLLLLLYLFWLNNEYNYSLFNNNAPKLLCCNFFLMQNLILDTYRVGIFGFFSNEIDYVNKQFTSHFGTRWISYWLQNKRMIVKIISIFCSPQIIT